MQRFVAIAVFAFATGCVGRGPQVLTPVRVDTVHAVGSPPAVTVMRPIFTTTDDPFHRIDRMDWPGPNAFRMASGAPGPDYWQQRADYTIAATLDTAHETDSRHREHPLHEQLARHTAFRLAAARSEPVPQPAARARRCSRPNRAGACAASAAATRSPASRSNGRGTVGRIDDTMMRIDLERHSLPRGGTLTIGMQYAFIVPDHGSDRMGRDSALYEIAQWYPRMAVYDDVRGWNTDPYLGQGEFYLEYGDIDYSVTVPAGYVVAGSGVLQNRAEVLSSAQIERLDRAAQSPNVVQVITRRGSDAAKRRVVAGTKTWRFRAEHVRDVAWAAAPDFRWDATSWDGVLTQAYYQFPKAGRAWESAAEQTQWSIRTYSELWLRYPYPQATSVAGPVGGMEYPMFVMVHYGTGRSRRRSSARSITSRATSGSRCSSARTSAGTRGWTRGSTPIRTPSRTSAHARDERISGIHRQLARSRSTTERSRRS